MSRPVVPAAILMSVSSRKSAIAVERHVVAAALHRVDLVLDQAEAGRAVGEGRAEDRHVMLIGELDQAVVLLAVAFASHLPISRMKSRDWNRGAAPGCRRSRRSCGRSPGAASSSM